MWESWTLGWFLDKGQLRWFKFIEYVNDGKFWPSDVGMGMTSVDIDKKDETENRKCKLSPTLCTLHSSGQSPLLCWQEYPLPLCMLLYLSDLASLISYLLFAAVNLSSVS